MKIFIASSKHFYDRIMPIKKFLESNGHEVVLPNSFEDPFAEEDAKVVSDEEHVKWKSNMMKKHSVTLKGLDAILVLNFEKKGIPNYIGGATFMEVVKSWEYGLKIFFYNPLPICSFTDELKGMAPVVINRNLEEVK